jgi:hypothetical protein
MPGPEGVERPMALRAGAVQVDRDIGRRAVPPQVSRVAGGQQLVHGARPLDERRQRRRGGEHDPVSGVGTPQRAQRRHRHQEVPEVQRAQRQEGLPTAVAAFVAVAPVLVHPAVLTPDGLG